MEQPYITVEQATGPLHGRIVVPSDKSITHRLLLFGSLRSGDTVIRNPATGADCQATLSLINSVGTRVVVEPHAWTIDADRSERHSSRHIIDCGNSGTTARIGAGLLVGEPGQWVLTGDTSLSKRPMDRIVMPLSEMGAAISSADGIMPIEIDGTQKLPGLSNEHAPIDVRSAQVHASLLLAGMRSEAGVRVRKTLPMRDHTIRLARNFGWPVESRGAIDGIPPDAARMISEDDRPLEYIVPGDVSAAAFLIAAALLVHGSDITIERVGLNPTRLGFLKAANKMGGHVRWTVTDDRWEPAGSVDVKSGPLNSGIEIAPDTDPSTADCIDELPLIALLGAFANGETVVRGADDLRAKESDRIGTTVSILQAMGADIDELDDGFVVRGRGGLIGGDWVDPRRDHRLTMMSAVAGLVVRHAVTIPEPDSVNASWPEFWDVIDSLTGGRSIR